MGNKGALVLVIELEAPDVANVALDKIGVEKVLEFEAREDADNVDAPTEVFRPVGTEMTVVITSVSVNKPVESLEAGPEAVIFDGTGNKGVLFLVTDRVEVVGRPDNDDGKVMVMLEPEGKGGLPPTASDVLETTPETELTSKTVLEVETLPGLEAVPLPVPLTDHQLVVVFEIGKRGVLVLVCVSKEVVGSLVKVSEIEELKPTLKEIVLATEAVVPDPGGPLKIIVDVIGRIVKVTSLSKLVWTVNVGLVPIPDEPRVELLKGAGKGGVTIPEGIPVEDAEPVLVESLADASEVVEPEASGEDSTVDESTPVRPVTVPVLGPVAESVEFHDGPLEGRDVSGPRVLKEVVVDVERVLSSVVVEMKEL